MAIRSAVPSDNAAIAAIWNREVLQTSATTDTEPRSVAAQQAWLAAHGPAHPVIVAVEGDEVVAFGALSPYRAKPSYARTVEDSVYVKDWLARQGPRRARPRSPAGPGRRARPPVGDRPHHRGQRGVAGAARAAGLRPSRARARGRLQARHLARRGDTSVHNGGP